MKPVTSKILSIILMISLANSAILEVHKHPFQQRKLGLCDKQDDLGFVGNAIGVVGGLIGGCVGAAAFCIGGLIDIGNFLFRKKEKRTNYYEEGAMMVACAAEHIGQCVGLVEKDDPNKDKKPYEQYRKLSLEESLKTSLINMFKGEGKDYESKDQIDEAHKKELEEFENNYADKESEGAQEQKNKIIDNDIYRRLSLSFRNMQKLAPEKAPKYAKYTAFIYGASKLFDEIDLKKKEEQGEELMGKAEEMQKNMEEFYNPVDKETFVEEVFRPLLTLLKSCFIENGITQEMLNSKTFKNDFFAMLKLNTQILTRKATLVKKKFDKYFKESMEENKDKVNESQDFKFEDIQLAQENFKGFFNYNDDVELTSLDTMETSKEFDDQIITLE